MLLCVLSYVYMQLLAQPDATVSLLLLSAAAVGQLYLFIYFKETSLHKLHRAFIAVAYAHKACGIHRWDKNKEKCFWYPPFPKNTAVDDPGAASRNFPKDAGWITDGRCGDFLTLFQ
ncbi:hypothetical protein XENOCAPTIV_012384 [Xenoophorus captivus]|uniref:Uncharacterized protein n=1 Tax=Xenoophorus captivus TaxID=1517983 RepID=A0ABV0R1D0_9TELE